MDKEQALKFQDAKDEMLTKLTSWPDHCAFFLLKVNSDAEIDMESNRRTSL